MDIPSKVNLALSGRVNKSKDLHLKVRLDTLIKNAGLDMRTFLRQIQISKQLWYYYSWGVWDCPPEVKIRIAQLLKTDSSIIWRSNEKFILEKKDGEP